MIHFYFMKIKIKIKMGINQSYEGYGKNYREAAINLGYMLRYHHGNVTVHMKTEGSKNVYYAFDGEKHPIHFTKSNERIRAFL